MSDHMRLVVRDVPHVYNAGDQVVLQVSPAQAKELADILSALSLASDVVTLPWYAVRYELLHAAARADTINVPLRSSSPDGPRS